MLRDPELIKQLAVKEFDHFVNHRQALPDNIDPLWSRNVLALRGNCKFENTIIPANN